jgi:hypothetical protein
LGDEKSRRCRKISRVGYDGEQLSEPLARQCVINSLCYKFRR